MFLYTGPPIGGTNPVCREQFRPHPVSHGEFHYHLISIEKLSKNRYRFFKSVQRLYKAPTQIKSVRVLGLLQMLLSQRTFMQQSGTALGKNPGGVQEYGQFRKQLMQCKFKVFSIRLKLRKRIFDQKFQNHITLPHIHVFNFHF